MAHAHISLFLLFSRCWLDSLWCKLNFDCFLLNFTNLQKVGMGSVHMVWVGRIRWHVIIFLNYYHLYLCVCICNFNMCGDEWSCALICNSYLTHSLLVLAGVCRGTFCVKRHIYKSCVIFLYMFLLYVCVFTSVNGWVWEVTHHNLW